LSTEIGFCSDAIYVVRNIDGGITTLSKKRIPLSENGFVDCDMTFPIDDGNQSIFNPLFPLTIKVYSSDFDPSSDPPEAEGTYVSFTCDGLDSFKLAALYQFGPDKLWPIGPGLSI
jgi:hypothetical protein